MEAVVTSGNEAAPAALQDAGLAELEAIASPSRDLARRDSLRRRALAGADVGALLIAYLSVWLAASPDLPANTPTFAAIALPGWILLNKLLGLYDRDAHLIHKSTLDEMPRLALSAILGTTLIFMFAPPIAERHAQPRPGHRLHGARLRLAVRPARPRTQRRRAPHASRALPDHRLRRRGRDGRPQARDAPRVRRVRGRLRRRQKRTTGTGTATATRLPTATATSTRRTCSATSTTSRRSAPSTTSTA